MGRSPSTQNSILYQRSKYWSAILPDFGYHSTRDARELLQFFGRTAKKMDDQTRLTIWEQRIEDLKKKYIPAEKDAAVKAQLEAELVDLQQRYKELWDENYA